MCIGFLGAGNMGGAILDGILKKKFSDAKRIFVSRKNPEALINFCHERGVNPCASNIELVEKSDILVLGIKPQQMTSVLEEIKVPLQEKKPILISLLAGTEIKQIEKITGPLRIVRVMPNLNAKIGESMTGLCFHPSLSDPNKAHVTELFQCLGKTLEIEENQFSIFTALAGSSPAFIFILIEALAMAGVKEGMTKKDARMVATQAVLGSAKNVMQSDTHPMAMVDAVCSPGGTTIAGVASLEEDSFTATLMRAVAATSAKDRDLKK